ncbi:MAG: L-threonylcarbamoyladenylate synthase [Flavobacteriaceae bacterium]
MNIIAETLEVLKSGGSICYPTDTVWGLGCDAQDIDAVSQIYKIKNRASSKSLIVLVSDLNMLNQYVEKIPKQLDEILSKSNRPISVIYPKAKNLASNVIAQDGSVAIRIVQDDFCKELIEKFGSPIVSTSANISGEPTPTCYKEISPLVLDKVNYIVNLRLEEINTQSSKIIRLLEDGQIEVIRE